MSQIFKDELNIDPLSRGYASMTDQEVSDSLNTEDRSYQLDRLEHAEVFEAMDDTEWEALSPDDGQTMIDLLQMGGSYILVGSGTRARKRIINLFGLGSQTIANLLVIITKYQSRGAELGIGHVTSSAVERVRVL